MATDGGDVTVQDGDPDNGAATYGASTCVWTFTNANHANTIGFFVDGWSLGYNNDRLQFFDGGNITSPLIGTLVGHGQNQQGWATGNRLTMVLTTDNFPHNGGFKVEVGVDTPPGYCASYQVVNSTMGNQFYSINGMWSGTAPYKANHTCAWLFNLVPGELSMRLELMMQAGNLAWGDYVEVFDGPTTASPLLGRQGAGQDGAYYWPNGAQALVRFVALPGDKLCNPGMSIKLVTFEDPQHCGPVQIINTTAYGDTYGEPPNPGWKCGYLPGAYCTWLFQAPPGKWIVYKFDELSINGGDQLIVYEGADTSAPSTVLDRSNRYGPEITYKTQQLFVTFRSNIDVQPSEGNQFYFEVWHTDPITQCTAGPNWIVQHEVDSDLYPGNIFGTPSNQEWDGIARIAPGLHCQWIIESADDNDIYLGSQIYFLNPGDQLFVYSMDDVTNATTGVYNITGPAANGQRDPNWWQLNIKTKRAMVVFNSSPIPGAATGWQIYFDFYYPDYSAPCGPGIVQYYPDSDPNGNYGVRIPGNFNYQFYPANFTCRWLVNGSDPVTGVKQANFMYFSSRDDYDLRPGDSIRVYNGKTISAPLLAVVTGRGTSGTVQQAWTNVPYMLIVFTSLAGSAPTNHTGFNAYVGTTDDDTYDYYYDDPCDGQGTYPSWTTADGSLWVQSGNWGYYQTYPRNITCTWHVHRSDVPPGGGGFWIKPHMGTTRINFDSYVIVYDGPTTAAPIIFSIINGVESWYNSDASTVSATADVTVVFHGGETKTDQNGGDQLLLELYPFTTDNDDYPNPNFCSGFKTVNLSDSDQHRVAPFAGYNFMLQPNMHCRFLIQPDPSNSGGQYYQDQVISFYHERTSYEQDIFPSQYNITVYDGPNANSPVLWSRANREDVVFSKINGVLFMTVDTISGQLQPQLGFSPIFRMQGFPHRCEEGFVSHMDNVEYVQTNWWWNGLLNTPGPTRCSWQYTGQYGAIWIMNGFDVSHMLPHEQVTVYDGPDAGSPRLYALTQYGRVNYAEATTQHVLYIEWETNRTDQSYGFSMYIVAAIPPPDICKDATLASTTYYYPGTGYVMGNGQDAYVPGDGNVDEYFRSHGFPQHPTFCTHTWIVPMGYYLAFNFNYNLMGGQIDIFNNGGIMYTAHGQLEDPIYIGYMCGNVTIRINVTTFYWNTFWRMEVGMAQFEDTVPYYCREPNDVVCGVQTCWDDPNPALGQLKPYENCTIFNGDIFFSLSGTANPSLANFSLPKLRDVTGDVDIYTILTPASISLPSLRMFSTLNMDNVALPPTFGFPSLRTATNLCINNAEMDTISFPSLKFISKISISATSVVTINLNSVYAFDYQVCIKANHYLTTVNMSNALWFHDMTYTQNEKLATVNLPSVTGWHYYHLDGALIPSVILPSVNSVIYAIQITGCPVISEVSLPNLTGMNWIDACNNNQLQKIDLPQVTWMHDEFCVRSAHLTDVYLPSLVNVQDIYLTGMAYLTTISAPNLVWLGDLQLEDSVVSAISFPSLKYIAGNAELKNNFKLTELNFCNMTESNAIEIYSCPLLSCQETITLFNSTGAGYFVVAPPDCDANLLGTFGCAENLVHTVNVASCGYTVACIQKSIDASYFDKGAIVSLPNGTYTGCSVPLNANGKRITIRGATGLSRSIIDCGGSGQALVINTDETSAFIIQDLTLKNGQAITGGLVMIAGASPTFQRVIFSAGLATTGGGVHISQASRPTFVDCIFQQSTAQDGGAVAVVGAAVTLMGCTFESNTAANQAGALFVTAAAGRVEVRGSHFFGNAADQGGAILTDSALIVSGATLSDNRAAQFGGALASVPADAAAGTWTNVSDSFFENNEATTGGAIYGFSSNLAVSNTSLSGNRVVEDGGAISALCSPSYRILRGIKDTCAVYVLIDDSVVFNNSATGNGAGVIVQNSRLFTSGGLWSANKAGGSGGALYSTSSLLSTKAAVMSANVAKKTGGALYCEPYTGSCDVSTSTFTGNSATVAGGGVYMCTSSCPNVTRSGLIISDGPLPDLTGSNTFDNSVATSGYGKDLGSDPAKLTWLVPPLDTVISGRTVSTSGSISVQVTDNFDSVVTSSKTILALSLEVTDASGGDLEGKVTVSGSNTALAVRGTAVFSEPLLVANTIADANSNILVSVRLSDTVAITRTVALNPCASGQGRSAVAGDPVVCADCAAGTAGSADTNYICVACPAGSAAATANLAVCTTCDVNTHAPLAGSTACLPCSAGYSAPQTGSIDCVQDAAAAITAPASVVVPAVGASAGALLLIIIGAFLLWRLARRKTMQKYYLDSDSTIRASGMEETPLMKSIKKIIGASSTTRAGGGMFADVYKAKYENKWIALKVIKKELVSNSEAQMEFRREAVALSRLMERRCRGIVELAFFLERNPMCVAMEFCNNGTLKRLLPLRELAVFDKVRMAAESAAAMVVVHGCNIVHLDLKTDNLLLDDDMHVKLADFGISRLLDQRGAAAQAGAESMSANPVFSGEDLARRGSVANSLGSRDDMGSLSNLGSFGVTAHVASEAFTPQYVDPLRMIDSTNQKDDFLRASDVFSFGIVMWTIYSQEEPYAGQAPDVLMKELRSNPTTRPRDIPGIHGEYERIMRQCWHKDPFARPSFLDVRTRLTHLMRDEFSGHLADGYVIDGSGSNDRSQSSGGDLTSAVGLMGTLDSNQFSGKAPFSPTDTLNTGAPSGLYAMPPPPPTGPNPPSARASYANPLASAASTPPRGAPPMPSPPAGLETAEAGSFASLPPPPLPKR